MLVKSTLNPCLNKFKLNMAILKYKINKPVFSHHTGGKHQFLFGVGRWKSQQGTSLFIFKVPHQCRFQFVNLFRTVFYHLVTLQKIPVELA